MKKKRKKLKKLLANAMLYTAVWRNVDKLYSIWHYDSYYVKLKKKERRK